MTKKFLKLAVRLVLFFIVVSVGTTTALIMDETQSLALTELAHISARGMAVLPESNTIYANFANESRPAGVYRSHDNGRTWQRVSVTRGLMFNTLTAHPVSAGVLYAGTGGGPLGETNNVYRSTDGGRTWHNFNLSLPASHHRIVPAITALVVDPDHPDILYVGTAGHGVYRFDEGQIGYELVGGTSLYAAHIKSLLVVSGGPLYALTNGGLFANTSAAWQKIDTLPVVPLSVAIAPGNPQRIYAANPLGGAYRSDDGGQTWENIGQELNAVPGLLLKLTAMVVDPQDPNHLVAATAYGLQPAGIYESYTAGERWARLGYTKNWIEELTFNQGTVFAATGQGLGRFPLKPAIEPLPWNSGPLTRLSGTQILLLALTAGLAGLALLAQPNWFWQRSQIRVS